jgi:hypothetical protein
MNAAPNEKVWSEEFEVTGRAVVDTVKDLLHEGNVRRVTIKNAEGKTVISVPATVGVIGVLVAPTVAAIGAIVAMGADYTIVVERHGDAEPSEPPPQEP